MGQLLRAEVKKSYKREIKIISILFVLFLALNHSYLDKQLELFFSNDDSLVNEEGCFVERVVDGDTIVACENTTRLLGINTPEKGERFYSEAKRYLSERIENKTVKLTFSKEKYDKYGRVLAYIYFNDSLINAEIIENGFANPYFPSEKDSKHKQFFDSWERCVENSKGICKSSTDRCSKCIVLKKLDSVKEEVILKNNCQFVCNISGWSIKDEGRKNFIFKETLIFPKKEILIYVSSTEKHNGGILWNRTDSVWTDSGDTLFLRDSKGDLVLWKNYF